MEQSVKREEILKSAALCFARYGYDKTTMDDIGKPVGLNKASLYYYYKNKEAIFTEILIRETEKFFEQLKKTVYNISGCREKIFTYIIERFQYMRQFINLHKLSIESTSQFQPLFKQLIEMFCERETAFVSEILVSCVESQELMDFDTKRVAKAIMSVTDGIKQQHLNSCEFTLDVSQIDYSAIEEDLKYTIGLILDGLSKQKK